MNLSALFIKRPIGTTLLAFGLAIAGIVAFYLLPVSSLPQIDFPTISVTARLPGASPETMASSVATPLERQLGYIAGVNEIISTSTLGATRITLQFDLSRNIDGAARDVQAAINAASSQLPANLPIKPSYYKVNPADAPIMILALTSKHYTTGQIYDVASTILQQKLSQVAGIGEVDIGGSSLPAVRIELNPTTLNKYHIGLNDIANVVAATNANRPKGQLNTATVTSTITMNDQLFKAEQYKPLIIAYRNNAPVRLADVAQVNDSVENLRNAGLANGKPAVLIVLFKQPGANVINTVEAVRNLLPQFNAVIAKDIDITVVLDRTDTIRGALHDAELSLIIAMGLVILVVYLFLRNSQAMLIAGIAVLLSLLGTFAVMYLLGFSLNNLSLMALTISTGFVVDDAIVVLENISRYIEKGMQPLAAALVGTKEVGFTVLAMSLSLIAVFLPILLMGGMVGRLFHEFAVTLSVAILISLLISLTVTPMLCARFLQGKRALAHSLKKDTLSVDGIVIKKVKQFYAASLTWVLQHPGSMLLGTCMVLILNIGLWIWIPKGFFPQQDTGRIAASIQGAQDISFQAMQQKLTQFVELIQKDPAVAAVVGFVGGGAKASNAGNLFITLKPLAQRGISADGVVNRLRKKLMTVTGATLYMQAAQDLIIGGRQSNSQFQYAFTADNLQELNRWMPKIIAQVKTVVGIADVNSDQLTHGLQTFITIDHDAASRFGITSQLIDTILYSAFGQRQIATLYGQRNQYHVVMEVAPPYWQQPETLQTIYVHAPSGQEVPLAAFASFAPASTLLSVNHQGQMPAATLSFNLLPNVALGDAVNRVENTIKQMRLPADIQGSFRGAAQVFQASLAKEGYLILAALLAVYIVLGILYESMIHPITILSTLPSAGVGALLALLLTRTDLNIVALIGVILLIGIVKKNAIMMIDFALAAERTEQQSPQAAIYQAALLRFRPIMMTTLAAMFGAIPLVFNMGLGAEIRRPLGITIIGGLLLSQMLTLYSTPVIYLELENLCQWFQKQFNAKFPFGRH